jgi:hypothetical protein
MLTVNLSPSRALLMLQCMLHTLAAMAVLVSSMSLLWKILACIFTLTSLINALFSGRLMTPCCVQSFEIEFLGKYSGQQNDQDLQYEQGKQHVHSSEDFQGAANSTIAVPPDRRLPARLSWFYCLAWLQLIVFQHQQKHYIAVVFPDSAKPAQRRQLRAYLRSSACFNALIRGKNGVFGNR